MGEGVVAPPPSANFCFELVERLFWQSIVIKYAKPLHYLSFYFLNLKAKNRILSMDVLSNSRHLKGALPKTNQYLRPFPMLEGRLKTNCLSIFRAEVIQLRTRGFLCLHTCILYSKSD